MPAVVFSSRTNEAIPIFAEVIIFVKSEGVFLVVIIGLGKEPEFLKTIQPVSGSKKNRKQSYLMIRLLFLTSKEFAIRWFVFFVDEKTGKRYN